MRNTGPVIGSLRYQGKCLGCYIKNIDMYKLQRRALKLGVAINYIDYSIRCEYWIFFWKYARYSASCWRAKSWMLDMLKQIRHRRANSSRILSCYFDYLDTPVPWKSYKNSRWYVCEQSLILKRYNILTSIFYNTHRTAIK